MRHLQRLRVLRAEHDLTQLELARDLGWSAARYWRVENGHRFATAEERRAVAEFFAVDPSEIWDEEVA